MANPRPLSDLYTQLTNIGVKLSHQYQLSFSNVPTPIASKTEDITLWAAGANLPGRTQNVTDISYLGFAFNVDTNFSMTNDLQCTIYCDANLSLRESLLFWMGLSSDPDVGGLSAGGGIKTASTVRGILDLYNDRMDTITHTYELIGIRPIVVGDSILSNENAEIMSFDAQFKYQFWNTVTTPNGGLVS